MLRIFPVQVRLVCVRSRAALALSQRRVPVLCVLVHVLARDAQSVQVRLRAVAHALLHVVVPVYELGPRVFILAAGTDLRIPLFWELLGAREHALVRGRIVVTMETIVHRLARPALDTGVEGHRFGAFRDALSPAAPAVLSPQRGVFRARNAPLGVVEEAVAHLILDHARVLALGSVVRASRLARGYSGSRHFWRPRKRCRSLGTPAR